MSSHEQTNENSHEEGSSIDELLAAIGATGASKDVELVYEYDPERAWGDGV